VTMHCNGLTTYYKGLDGFLDCSEDESIMKSAVVAGTVLRIHRATFKVPKLTNQSPKASISLWQ
jgi:hypothetical protein